MTRVTKLICTHFCSMLMMLPPHDLQATLKNAFMGSCLWNSHTRRVWCPLLPPRNKLVRCVIYAWNMKKKKRNTTKCWHVFFKSKGYGAERNKNSALQFLSCMLFQLPEWNAVHSITFCMAEDTESFSFWEELKIYFKSIQSKR